MHLSSGGPDSPDRDAISPESFRRHDFLYSKRAVVQGVCIFLVVLIWIAFGQTVRYGFVNYDDDIYVYQNPTVAAGFTSKGILWAFTFAEIGHWHPVTWFSHMLDCRLYGLWPGGHHLMNVLLHAAATILLFLALTQMTGGPSRPRNIWRSTFVAALFAIHPLRVESVAWIAERKDVLSGVFFMLILLAYTRYVREQPSITRYSLVVIAFALGLMSKGMLVTVPFLLLLLDYWPLGRLKPETIESILPPENRATIWHLIAEKIPLFLLSAASCVVTALSPEKIAPAFRESFLLRMENAGVSYVIYLKQMFYPVGLILPYFNPPGRFPVWQMIFAAAMLIAISIGALLCWKTRPYFVVGWLWYLGMMVPVIGIAQISYYARADRYTYLPQIGLYVVMTWGVAELLGRWHRRRELLGAPALLLIAALVISSRVQASHWHNSETLWRYVLSVSPNNFVAHNNLGLVLDQTGRTEAAITEYEEALQIQPAYAETHNNLGNALSRMGRLHEAIGHYRKALDLVPDLPQVHNNLGTALAENGQLSEAMAHFQKALNINPQFAGAHNNFGYALLKTGQIDQALPHLLKALELKPDSVDTHKLIADVFLQKGRIGDAIAHYRIVIEARANDADAHFKLALALAKNGQWNDAIAHYRTAARLQPSATLPRTNLAWLLATAQDEKIRDGPGAVLLAKESCELTENPDAQQLDTLAAAYAELRDFEAATKVASRALGKAKAVGDDNLSRQIGQRLEVYRRHQPYRQPPNE
jgi:tetratricopeptide (TPR) repeat protein